MQLPLIFYTFALLPATGVCLECEHCTSERDSCDGLPHQCPEYADGCVIFTTESISGSQLWLYTFKGCVRRKHCPPHRMSFTFPSERKRTASKCCSKNLCNKGAVRLPPGGTTPNGLICPGCFSPDPDCIPIETVSCHGTEHRCVYYDTTVQQDNKTYNFSKRGCGSRYACVNRPRSFGVPEIFVEIWRTAQCLPPSKDVE